MSRALSPSVSARYGLARVCRVLEVPRSTVYATKTRRTAGRLAQRRGPTPRWSDAALLEQIQEVLAAAPFVGEGHRKVWARARVATRREDPARLHYLSTTLVQ